VKDNEDRDNVEAVIAGLLIPRINEF